MPNPHIRLFEPADLTRVAALFQAVFRGRHGPPPAALVTHLREIFIDHPARLPDFGSLVHVRGDGTLDGFIGALPMPMTLRGTPVRAVVAGAFMVEDPRVSPAAGARLVRRLLAGPQDLTISDTTNRRSFDFQRVLRCHTLAVQSLQWTKVIRPASYVASLMAAHAPRAMSAPLRPAARLFDPMLARHLAGNVEQRPGRWREAPITVARFADAYRDFASRFALRPAWDRNSLLWLLNQAGAKQGLGRTLLTGVFRADDTLAGAYFAFARPGDKAIAMQIVSDADAVAWTLGSLFAQAAALGCVSVHGNAQPLLMDALFRTSGVMFRHASGTHVHTARPDLLEAVQSGKALIGGLVGEGWTRLVSDDFADVGPAGALAAMRRRVTLLWPRLRPPPVRTPAE